MSGKREGGDDLARGEKGFAGHFYVNAYVNGQKCPIWNFEDKGFAESMCKSINAALSARVAPLVEALEEIRRGKDLEDKDNYAIMAARLVGIAKKALEDFHGPS